MLYFERFIDLMFLIVPNSFNGFSKKLKDIKYKIFHYK